MIGSLSPWAVILRAETFPQQHKEVRRKVMKRTCSCSSKPTNLYMPLPTNPTRTSTRVCLFNHLSRTATSPHIGPWQFFSDENLTWHIDKSREQSDLSILTTQHQTQALHDSITFTGTAACLPYCHRSIPNFLTSLFFSPPELLRFYAGTCLILEEPPQWDPTQAQRGALLVKGPLNGCLLCSTNSRIWYKPCHCLPVWEAKHRERRKHYRKYIAADKVNGFNCWDSKPKFQWVQARGDAWCIFSHLFVQ